MIYLFKMSSYLRILEILKKYEPIFRSKKYAQMCNLILEAVKGRTNQQNRYFHGVIVPIVSDATGHTLEETKELLKVMYAPKEIETKKGVIKIGTPTSSMKKHEMQLFIDNIIVNMAEFGIDIPSPEETLI